MLHQVAGYTNESKWSYKYAGFAEYGDKILYFEVVSDTASTVFIHGLRVYNKGQAFKLVDKAVNLLSNIPDVHEFTLSSLDFLVEELVFAQMKKSDIDGFTELNSDTVWDNLVEPTISL